MAAISAPSDPSWVRILIVDDEEMVLSVLKEQLQPEGYHVTAVNSPHKALEVLQRENFSVILADQEMPEITGLNLLAKVKESHPTITRLLISSGLTLAVLSDSIKSDQIYRFITKPWLREEMRVTLHNAVGHNRLVTENKTLHERNVHLNLQISKMAEAQEHDAAAGADGADPMAAQGDGMSEGGEPGLDGAIPAPQGVELAVDGFVKMLYTFLPNLGSTSLRAVALCQTLGETLELPPSQLKSLLWAAALHDIALVEIDRGIVRRWLRGADKCTEEEMVLIKKHPEQSQKMLEQWPFFEEAGELIRCHHEHFDGTGYPDGFKGEMIPPLASYLSVAVAYCSKHSPSVQALTEIEAEEGKMFAPEAITNVARAVPLTKMPRGEREILLREMKEGHVLARGIHNANGILFIPKGKPMTEVLINRVLGIDRQNAISPFVYVHY